MDESSFRMLISGQSKGLLAATLRACLFVCSIPYRWIVAVRNFLFDCGVKPTYRASMPVISVGNITTGGTGKTPVVALVVQTLTSAGRRTAIVSRGYRAAVQGVNDEYQVLQQLCPQIPHLQNPDRIISAKKLEATGEADVIVMDDGFQHRRLHRDLDIVLIDATNPFGFGSLLPRGLLREPLNSLSRAQLVMITRADLADAETLEQIEKAVINASPGLTGRICRVRFAPSELLSITNEKLDAARFCSNDPSAGKVFLMSGIGNPESFEQTCRQAGFEVKGHRWFRDHHHYTRADLESVEQAAVASGADMVLGTQKDLVKVADLDPMVHVEVNQSGSNAEIHRPPFFALSIRAAFLTNADRDVFHECLASATQERPEVGGPD
ncbi:MAG: tetraacyldisaccharide 4'-kinase [Planctomycetaceae bacterium]|nr:tetraacyldisaccharide 4'-kinase [Planctomycetaceae bacterium]